jgi:hypothetical protein
MLGADLVLLILQVWDHGTKGSGPGWRGHRRTGGGWRASGAVDRGTAVVVFSFAGGDRLVVWLALADLAIRCLAPDGEAQLPVEAGLDFGHDE